MADEQYQENALVAADDAVGEFLAEKALPPSARHNAASGGSSRSASRDLTERQPSLDAQWNLEFVTGDAASADEFLSEKQLRRRSWFAAASPLPGKRAIQAGLATSALLGIALLAPRGAASVVRVAPSTTATTAATAPARIAGAPIPELFRAEPPSNSASNRAAAEALGPVVALAVQTNAPLGLPARDSVPLNRVRAEASTGSNAATRADAVIDSRADQPRASATAVSGNDVTDPTNATQETRLPSSNQPGVSSGDSVSATAEITTPVGPGIRPAISELTPAADESRDARVLPSAATTTIARDLSVLDAEPVRDLLAGYRTAYERLDARLAKQVWPAVDERALARAFDALESQTVTFDTCSMSVGEERAVATCRGSATYVTRMGRRTSHTEPRQWTFQLEKSPQRWVIGGVHVR
jgi:hypothetical protein